MVPPLSRSTIAEIYEPQYQEMIYEQWSMNIALVSDNLIVEKLFSSSI